MGLKDKFRELQQQAQTAVADHKGDIQNAVETVGAAANQKTNGKYADKIMKVGDKVNSTVEKVSVEESEGAEGSTRAPDASAEPTTQAPTEPKSPPAGPGSPPPDFA